MFSQKTNALLLILICQVGAMALWFSASAALGDLVRDYALSSTQTALMSSLVAVGFVIGTLLSALTGLSDRIDPRRLFCLAASLGALANLGALFSDPSSYTILACRLITGIAMAGVYPVGMKMAASWAKADMGLLIGLMVAALVLGSALPHLFNALGGLDWTVTMITASLSAFGAALLILKTPLGPRYAKAAKFHPRDSLLAWQNKPLRFANLGYWGHMWELYAMWAWVGLFLQASFAQSQGQASEGLAPLMTFFVIASGALGNGLGGWLADRIGRTTVTMIALFTSGSCALIVGQFFGWSPWVLVPFCMVWGAMAAADSAQFSSCVLELSPPESLGTMVTLQTCAGFLLTLITIHAIPFWIDLVGWTWAFSPLAIGPFLGVWAMYCLRRHPDSKRLAHGAR